MTCVWPGYGNSVTFVTNINGASRLVCLSCVTIGVPAPIFVASIGIRLDRAASAEIPFPVMPPIVFSAATIMATVTAAVGRWRQRN